MRYFQLQSLGDQRKLKEHVCISRKPSGLGLKSYLLSEGGSVAAYYPENAEVHLKDAEPGLLLTDFLSNTLWCFIANHRTREVVEAICGNQDLEYFPFILFDQRGNRLSDDYCFIHPLRICNAVDRAASDISYEDDDPNGEILSVEEYVFNSELTKDLPPLFRVPEYTYDIFMNETLARALYEARIGNLFLNEVQLS